MSIFARFGPRTVKGGIYGAILFVFGLIIGSSGGDDIGAWLAILGILCMAPVLLKISALVLSLLWKVICRMIYEVFFEATRAMKDAKKSKNG
jgi:hypothetical protein